MVPFHSRALWKMHVRVSHVAPVHCSQLHGERHVIHQGHSIGYSGCAGVLCANGYAPDVLQ